MSVSKFYHFSAAGLFYGIETLEEAIAVMKEGGFVWFNFYQPLKRSDRFADQYNRHSSFVC